MVVPDVDVLRGELAHARLALRQAQLERVGVARALWHERVRRLAEQVGEDADGHAAPALVLA